MSKASSSPLHRAPRRGLLLSAETLRVQSLVGRREESVRAVRGTSGRARRLWVRARPSRAALRRVAAPRGPGGWTRANSCEPRGPAGRPRTAANRARASIGDGRRGLRGTRTAAEGILVTHFLTVRDVARSRTFYAGVLGGQVVIEENPCIVKLANSWIIRTLAADRPRTSRASRLFPTRRRTRSPASST